MAAVEHRALIPAENAHPQTSLRAPGVPQQAHTGPNSRAEREPKDEDAPQSDPNER